MTDPEDRAMLKKLIIADAAACLFMHFKQFGISGYTSCIAQDTTLQAAQAALPVNVTMHDTTMTKAMSRQASNIEKLMYTKAIAYMATIALERSIGLVTAGYMYEVLLVDHDNDFKRVHGKDFPSELTDAGWRSSFKAIYNYVAGYID
jgi:hypothetical protein